MIFQSKAIALLFWICVADLLITVTGIKIGVFSDEYNPLLAVFFHRFGIMGLMVAKLLFTIAPILSLVSIYKKYDIYRAYINRGCFLASGIYVVMLTTTLYAQI